MNFIFKSLYLYLLRSSIPWQCRIIDKIFSLSIMHIFGKIYNLLQIIKPFPFKQIWGDIFHLLSSYFPFMIKCILSKIFSKITDKSYQKYKGWASYQSNCSRKLPFIPTTVITANLVLILCKTQCLCCPVCHLQRNK